MKAKTGFRFYAITVILLICFALQTGGVMHAGAGTNSQDENASIRQESVAVFGEPAKINRQPKPDSASTIDPNREPSLNLPPAPPDPEKGPSGEEPATRDRGWSTIMTDGFEGIFPGPWQVYDGNGATNGEYYWDDDDFKPHTGSWEVWSANGGANAVDPEFSNYPNNMDSWMVYGPFDLSGCADSDFWFYYWNKSEINYDWFEVYASSDGSNYYGWMESGDSGGWKFEDFDLKGYLGDDSVWLAFRFISDGSITDVGTFLDDFQLWCYTETSVASWTFMVYLDGDNNLEGWAIDDFMEMSSVGSDSNVKILVQMDRIGGYDTSYDDWTDTRRYYVTAGMTPTAANGVSIGEANMGDPQTLLKFVRWAKASAPANHYVLALWDHGSGWRLRELEEGLIKAVAFDDTSGGDAIDMPELRNTLSMLTGGGASPFDIVGLDACLMAMVEVDNQIKPYASIRVGSEETEPGDGWPYNTILAPLKANPSMTATTLATTIVDAYYTSYGNGQTHSAVNLGTPYTTLNTAVNNLAVALMTYGSNYIDEVQLARNSSTQFSYTYYIDLWDLADLIRIYVPESHIQSAAQAVKDAVTAAVIHEHHGGTWPWARGISIYFPKTPGEFDSRYDGSSGFLQFTGNTQWDEWIHTYHNFANYPAMFSKLAPANGATGQPVSLTLSWDASAGATSYAYCIDTVNDGACGGAWVNVGGSTSAAVSLNETTTYYWQVRATNAAGTVYADHMAWRSFTTGTLPAAFNKSSPSSGATNQSTSPTLTWQTSSGATSYEYCYDTTNDNACSGWTSNGASTSKSLSGLSQNTTYYWHVRANNGIGSRYSNGSSTAFWSFTTGGPPLAFNKTAPTNGATNQPTSLTLTWNTSSGATSYSYCYDTNNNNVCDGSWINNGASTSVPISGLTSPTNYYWQVKAINSFGETVSNGGIWWNFTTANTAPYFTSMPTLTGTANSLYSYNITATDPDGDSLSITAPVMPAWLTLTPTGVGTAILSGTPTSADIGVNPVALNLSDGINPPVTQSFNIDIANALPETSTFKSVGTQDGWILEATETSNTGGTKNNTASTFFLGDDAANKQYRAILSFNTTLPGGAVITKVTLRIKNAGVVGTNPFNTHGNLLVDVRKGAFSNNNALQLSDFQAAASKASVGNIPKAMSSKWYTKVWTSGIFNYINTSGVTQFRLRFAKDDNNDLGADYLKIFSGNAGGADRPQLIIEYFVP